MSSELKPVAPGVFEPGPPPRLLGGLCPACGRKYFPRTDVCPRCLEPLESMALSTEGKIYGFTVVRTKPPFGLPEPYAVGYVDLEADGLRFCTPLDPQRIDDLVVDMPVTLRIGPLGVDNTGQPCLRYYFTPKDGDACDR